MKKTLAIVLAVLLCVSLIPSAFAADTMKLGGIGPLTGSYANYGVSVYQGAKIAVEEINALGDLQF